MMRRSYLISGIVLVAALVLILSLEVGSNVIVVEKRLDQFPRTIGKYKSFDISMESNVIKVLNTDAYIFRNYVSPEGEVVNLYIGYYGTQKGGRSDHTPQGCYPGAGWAIVREEKVELAMGSGHTSHRVVLNRLDVSNAGMNEIVYHWYQTNRDKIIASGIQLNLNRFMSRLMYNRNDGAFIRVSIDVYGDPGQSKERVEHFIRAIYPLIIEYWPRERSA